MFLDGDRKKGLVAKWLREKNTLNARAVIWQ